MDSLSKENIGVALALIGAWPVFKGWFFNFWSWNRKRKLSRLCLERDLIVSLKNSDRALIVFSVTTFLVVTAMLGISLLFHAIGADPKGKNFIFLIDWMLGLSIYIFSLYRLGQLNRVKKFDNTMAKLNRDIRKLESIANCEGNTIDARTF